MKQFSATHGSQRSIFLRLCPGIMYSQTSAAQTRFTTAPSGGIAMIKPDSSDAREQRDLLQCLFKYFRVEKRHIIWL